MILEVFFCLVCGKKCGNDVSEAERRKKKEGSTYDFLCLFPHVLVLAM